MSDIIVLHSTQLASFTQVTQQCFLKSCPLKAICCTLDFHLSYSMLSLSNLNHSPVSLTDLWTVLTFYWPTEMIKPSILSLLKGMLHEAVLL